MSNQQPQENQGRALQRQGQELPSYYDDDDGGMALAAAAADTASRASGAFAEYHARQTPATRASQQDALTCFSRYLQEAGVTRAAEHLYQEAAAWAGMSSGLLKGFRLWMLEREGYAVGTVNQRLAIVRQYCTLAHEAGALDDEALERILLVKGYGGKQARNLDADRGRRGLPTRKSTKKATPTPLKTSQGLRLKTTTTQPAQGHGRRLSQDAGLGMRDALLMGLLIEHALRRGEVAALTIENFDLEKGTLTFYREKTDETTTHRLHRHTRLAAEDYLAFLATEKGRTRGPLFVGYKGRPMTPRGIYDRVRAIGRQLGIEGLSPHDLRHFWTYDALANGTSLDRVQSGGNWKSPQMALRYAAHTSIANEGVKISE